MSTFKQVLDLINEGKRNLSNLFFKPMDAFTETKKQLNILRVQLEGAATRDGTQDRHHQQESLSHLSKCLKHLIAAEDELIYAEKSARELDR